MSDTPPLPPRAVPGPSPADPDAPSALVLVIDDTEGNRYAVSRLLRGVGMSVAEAGSGSAAFAQLAREVPDLVVLDINLPDISGHEICRIIKDAPRTAAVPVLHVSASFISNADRAYGLEHGADAYLTHPLDPDVFVATARALLRTGRADGERQRRYEIERRARRMAEAATARATVLQDVVAALARTMSANEVGQVALTHAATALDALGGTVAVTTADGTQLEMVGTAQLPPELEALWQTTPLDGDGLLAIAARRREPLVLDSAQAIADALPASVGDALASFDMAPVALYAVPLLVDEGPEARVLGVLLLLWDADGVPGPGERALLTTVADQCAQALERARLYAAERQARAEAEDASSAKTQLLSTLSHELRTPLNSIMGHLDLIDAGVYGTLTDGQRGALARASRSALYLNALINDLLNFARLSSGHADFEITDVPIGGGSGVLADVHALVAVQAQAQGVRVEDRCPDGNGETIVRADAEKVRIILVNLVTNAIKFTTAGGTVGVACAVDGDGGLVRIRVTDTGRGIAADQFERVFEPFVQVNRQDMQLSQQGVGLGLAISRSLARGMNGDLIVDSVLGEGSTFTLVLPRA